jgi:phosphotransferase system  glucose/maltose/N-acetylglucosamine-specific IIC component
MKSLLTTAFMFCMSAAFTQTVPAPQPIEEQYHINYWWWVLGVALAIGAGIIIYMLIKKDPKRDAVR